EYGDAEIAHVGGCRLERHAKLGAHPGEKLIEGHPRYSDGEGLLEWFVRFERRGRGARRRRGSEGKQGGERGRKSGAGHVWSHGALLSSVSSRWDDDQFSNGSAISSSSLAGSGLRIKSSTSARVMASRRAATGSSFRVVFS